MTHVVVVIATVTWRMLTRAGALCVVPCCYAPSLSISLEPVPDAAEWGDVHERVHRLCGAGCG